MEKKNIHYFEQNMDSIMSITLLCCTLQRAGLHVSEFLWAYGNVFDNKLHGNSVGNIFVRTVEA
jgi:hypothetical protein